MTRGTTPLYLFKIPERIPLEDGETISITFSQKKRKLVEKTNKDVFAFNGLHIIGTTLSQADTLKFRSTSDADIQIIIKTESATTLRSKIISVPVERTSKDGEI